MLVSEVQYPKRIIANAYNAFGKRYCGLGHNNSLESRHIDIRNAFGNSVVSKSSSGIHIV